MSLPCVHCPAAFLIAGADRRTEGALCRIDSTERGQRSDNLGPLAIVRAADSPAAYFGYCLDGRLQDVVGRAGDLGALATPAERDIADRARNSGARLSYAGCPSWVSEKRNRQAARLAEQPGERRVHHANV